MKPLNRRRLLPPFLIASVPLFCLLTGSLAQTAPSPQGTPPPDRLTAPGFVHDRLHLKAPQTALWLGEENTLDISVQGPPICRLLLDQETAGRRDAGGCSDAKEQIVVPRSRPDGSQYIPFVPQCLGRQRVRIFATFTDQKLDIEVITVDVVARNPPLKLAPIRSPSTIRMDLSERERTSRLYLAATYPGVVSPLAVPFKELSINVVQARGDPAIVVDPALGKIDALRIGHALIVATYKGQTSETCVLVTESAQTFSRQDCGELRTSQVNQPSRTEVADAMYAQNLSTLPYKPYDGRRGRFLADERVTLNTPDRPFKLAEQNAVEVTIQPGTSAETVARIECHTATGGQCVPWHGTWSRDSLALIENDGSRASIDVFPMKLGHEQFTFLILFQDGGVALKTTSAEVVEGSVKPRIVGEGCVYGPTPEPEMPIRLHIGGLSYEAEQPVYLRACYDGMMSPLLLQGPPVRYSVKSDGPLPVVQMDATKGQVKGLIPGQALIMEDFAGQTVARCVVVVPWERRLEPDLSNCRALRARYGVSLPPLRFRVAPPYVIEDAATPPPQDRPGVMGGVATAPQTLVVSAIVGGTLSPASKDRFEANERLKILPDGVVAVSGKTVRLPLQLRGPEILAVGLYHERKPRQTTQAQSAGGTLQMEAMQARLVRDADAHLFVELRPGTAPTETLRLDLLFADGGVASQTFSIPVKSPVSLLSSPTPPQTQSSQPLTLGIEHASTE